MLGGCIRRRGRQGCGYADGQRKLRYLNLGGFGAGHAIVTHGKGLWLAVTGLGLGLGPLRVAPLGLG